MGQMSLQNLVLSHSLPFHQLSDLKSPPWMQPLLGAGRAIAPLTPCLSALELVTGRKEENLIFRAA